MAYVKKPNTSTSSTTWVGEVDKLRGTPAGRARVPKAPRWSHLTRRPLNKKLTIQVTYRGGSEAWWLVEARGSHGAFPGHMCLHDVIREVTGNWAVTDERE